MIISGKAIKVGDNIDTDVIIPGRYLGTTDVDELAKHALEALDPEFQRKAREGVILVAGKNFGCGSSREEASLALKYAGVKGIIAESFARIFYRNSINIGLPVLEGRGIQGKVSEGDRLKIDVEKGLVVNETKKEEFQLAPLPDFIVNILRNGGLVPHLRKKLGK